MTGSARANVASSFTILKGALIEESYSYLSQWDPSQSSEQNLANWKDRNPAGLRSQNWIRDVAFVMSRRFDPSGRDIALTRLAQNQCNLLEWKPLLLWHITRDEFVLRDFLVNWLFVQFDEGVFRLRPEDLYVHLHSLHARGGIVAKDWSDTTIDRVAHALLVIAKDFGLLTGGTVKTFASFHLPEKSFLYLLHAMRDTQLSAGKLIASSDWCMFLMRTPDVELELLRLHQFRQIEYHVAGSLVQLTLPCTSSREYAARMAA